MALRFEPVDFFYDNHLWKIMKFKRGIKTIIMNKIFEQMNNILTIYSKVLVVRFDLRTTQPMKDNKLINEFNKKFKQKLKKQYNCEVAYIWVREQTLTSNNPHYHCAVMINGHKAQSSFGIAKAITAAINNLSQPLSVYYPENNAYKIKRADAESVQRAIYRLSYLAKKETKGNRPLFTSDYQASRLKAI
ncbi:hypothetical protein BTO11_05350 [Psychrosphaera saromensis]|uniref:YagK/YfjJ C-terminal domain-containing protein n=2 Tax=Psychrosphaera saromensis TaxID=716813 RepID=A0A2S7UTT0_9GAMM|nr:hypothetical protein BTO11_05350 [Psychrosphaera saromensis]